jgi:predicted transcriptional regulator
LELGGQLGAHNKISLNQAKHNIPKAKHKKQKMKGIDIMSVEKKLTKREKFEMIAKIEAVASNPILAEFVEHELDLLAKKNASGVGKQTATQKANEELKSAILAEMAKEPNRLFAVSEMIKVFPCCNELSLPKVTAVVTQMHKANVIERVEEKRKAYFRYIG